MTDDEFDFSEFDEDLGDEDTGKKPTDGETIEISGEDKKDDSRRKNGVPHLELYDIDDEIEPSDFDLTPRVQEFLDEHKTKLLKCVILEAKIVTGRSDYSNSAFARVTTDFTKDKTGRWIRTSSLAFKEQIESLIEKKAFPINVRLAEKRSASGTGKPYYVLNG